MLYHFLISWTRIQLEQLSVAQLVKFFSFSRNESPLILFTITAFILNQIRAVHGLPLCPYETSYNQNYPKLSSEQYRAYTKEWCGIKVNNF
jgi:hypothetical protein